MNFLERVGLVSQVKVGDYVVSANKPLGNGAFGTVNVGHKQTNAKEIVAIKIVRRHAKNDYLVQREIQLLQELKKYGCENILMFFFSEKDASNFYLVTEFCNGNTLTKLFTAKKRLSDVEAKIFMRQIASAMKFLDKEEIAHRDLKPDNILVNCNKVPNSVDVNDMTFKIADFGLATKIPKGKTANSKCGSCFYMAPEIFKVKYRFYDRKVDLWSIGVILYQGMVGVLPFKVRNMRKFEDMERLMSTPVNAVLPTWLSLDARDLINSLLTYCPTKRIDFEKFFEHPFLVKDKSTPPPPAAVPFPRLSATSVGTLVNTSSFEKQEDLLLNGMLAPTTIHDVSSNLMDFVIVDSQCCYMKSQKLDDKEILPKITPQHAEALCIIS